MLTLRQPKESKFDPFAQKVLIVVGKGGTGRTTLSRTLAKVSSRAGKKVSVVAGTSGTHFGSSNDENISFTSLEPGEVLISYLNDHGLGQLGRKLSSSGLASIISTAIPGIADLLVLAKVKQMEQSGKWDLIIFDAPASGHFLRLVATPVGLSEIANTGPLQKQSQDVLDMLNDEKRLGIVLVSLPEETPVKETIETVRALKKLSNLSPKALFFNSVIPSLITNKSYLESLDLSSPFSQAAKYTIERTNSQQTAMETAQNELGLEQLILPMVPTAKIDEEDIDTLALALEPQLRGSL